LESGKEGKKSKRQLNSVGKKKKERGPGRSLAEEDAKGEKED